MVICIKSSNFYARRIYRGGGNCMNASRWIVLWQAVSTIWAGLEVNVVAGHERRRPFPLPTAQNEQRAYSSPSNNDPRWLERSSFWNCCQDICHWFADLDVNLYFYSTFLGRNNFRLFIASWSVLFYGVRIVSNCPYCSVSVWLFARTLPLVSEVLDN